MKDFRKYLFWFLILVYVSGTIGMPLNREFFLPFTPLNLLLTSLVFLLYCPDNVPRYLPVFFGVALYGYLCEVIGVSTGIVFGNYRYGDSLGPKFLQVPLTISVNWSLLIACAVPLAGKITRQPHFIALLSASIVTLLDVLMEQVAPNLDFWYFEGGKAGLHNYVGWMFISFIASFAFCRTLLKGNAQIAMAILAMQAIFFSVMALVGV